MRFMCDAPRRGPSQPRLDSATESYLVTRTPADVELDAIFRHQAIADAELGRGRQTVR
jgi:hypothetical protein